MTATIDAPTKSDRYVLTRVGQQDLAFLPQWIDEFVVIERSQILSLAFYAPAVLGIAHHKGRVLPLVSLRSCLEGGEARGSLGDRAIALRLSAAAPTANGVGLVIDRLLGNQATLEPTTRLFKAQDISAEVWQPLRWQKSGAESL